MISSTAHSVNNIMFTEQAVDSAHSFEYFLLISVGQQIETTHSTRLSQTFGANYGWLYKKTNVKSVRVALEYQMT